MLLIMTWCNRLLFPVLNILKGLTSLPRLTPVPSELIRPFRVKESPAQLECKVKQIIELGQEGGAGNLVICEVVLMHISESVLDANGNIDPQKIDLVARMGANYYC